MKSGDKTESECRLYIGPMFSEKTSTILRHVKRARIAEIPCVIVKYSQDNRYGDGPVVYTHDGSSIQSGKNLRIVEAHTLGEVKLSDSDRVIAVDEGQFYPDLARVVDGWMREGRKIYIAALDGDYLRKPFASISELLPLCTHITKLHAICMICKRREGVYTHRTVQSNERELIGGVDKYAAACLKCYLAACESE